MADETEYRIPIIADISQLLSGFAQAGDAATAMGDKMSSAGDKGKAGVEKLGEGAEKAESKLKELKEGVNENLEAVTKMMGGWEGLLGVLGAGAAAEVLSKIAETTMELGDNIAMTAAALTVSAADARAFNETMSSLGIDAGAAAMAIRRLEIDAANGGKQLSRLGVSVRDANGEMKNGMALFEETIEKIRNLKDASQQAEAAYVLFGRGGMQLLSVINQIKPKLDESREAMKAQGDASQHAADTATVLHDTLTQLRSAWESAIIQLAPQVVASFQAIEIVVINLTFDLKQLIAALGLAFAELGDFAKSGADLLKFFGEASHLPEEGGGYGADPDALNKSIDALDKVQADTDSMRQHWIDFGNTLKTDIIDTGTKTQELINKITEELKTGKVAPLPSEPDITDKTGEFKDLPGKKGPKGPQALDAEQISNALDDVNNRMDTMGHQYEQLGNESNLVRDKSLESFAELRDEATADYKVMEQKYLEFVEAVQTGSKKGAEEAKKAWENAATAFENAFRLAKEKAKQDMQEMKAAADTMASEVSGILNSAISGKLNWVTELDKILSKMVDELTKYLFEMLGLMMQHNSLEIASQQAAHGNMVGELIGWVGKMLGIKTAGNTADTTQQVAHDVAINTSKATAQATGTAILSAGMAAQTAIHKAAAVTQGTTDAGVAAANTMAALTPIPFVGPAIAAATAPGIFAETMSYAVAEAGFDVPPGLKPLTQLHPREMVLPESIASGVRNMTSGSASNIPGAQVNQNINLQAWDGQSVVDMLLGNGNAIAGALQGALRSGLMLNTGG